MNKKQKNRKLVTQNKRNRMVNRRYTSTIKTLSKLFKLKLKDFNQEANLELKAKLKLEILKIGNNIYSILDKAVKKSVIHKNNGSRKKSTIGKLSSLL
jgi:small subunit ribosomal protein S20